MQKILYAIIDLAADEVISTFLYNHDAAAIRTFRDIAGAPDNNLSKHPADFNLIELGLLTKTDKDIPTIIPNPTGSRIVLTGAALIAATEPKLVRHAEPEGA